MKSHKLEGANLNCPKCTNLIDGVTGSGHDSAPSTGDITVCFYCAEVLEFDSGMRFKRFEQFEELDPDAAKTVKQVQAKIKARILVKEGGKL